MQTPFWITLAVAAIGVIGTLAGVIVTQHQSNARERWSFERGREQERERWLRDDAARTFERRRGVYEDFYGALMIYGNLVEQRSRGMISKVSNEPFSDVYRISYIVQLYGTSQVFDAARSALESAGKWSLEQVGTDQEKAVGQEYFSRRAELVDAIKNDLHLPARKAGNGGEALPGPAGTADLD
ncbi:hypothetical protein [Paractinoplanes maris]|uniref:hypothetical protein n=1 Tax=Paractinoplanes maris TaxID=1734446 RepID=UPI002022216E|nr:hypothetical protein [Actinoplanes maris]